MENQTRANQQQRNLLLFMMIPGNIFLVVMFYIFGGGGSAPVAESEQKKEVSGLATSLPAAEKESPPFKDKISAYISKNKADKEKDLLTKTDNHFKWLMGQDTTATAEVDPLNGLHSLKNPNELAFAAEEAEDESSKLDQELADLEKKLKTRSGGSGRRPAKKSPPAETDHDADLARRLAAYEQQQLKIPDTASALPDEFTEMQGMLDKILDIQHPDRVAERLRKKSLDERGNFYSVNAQENHVPISYLGESKKDLYEDRLREFIDQKKDSTYRQVDQASISGFMGLKGATGMADENTLKAVVHGKQDVVNGSTAKLRVLSPLVVAGHHVPANSYVYGKVSLQADRVNIDINSIEVDQTVLPVAMQVYDLDGMEGLSAPDLASIQEARRAVGQSSSALQLEMANPNITTRALDEGVKGIRQLLRRKAQIAKATLKNNYQVYLLNQQSIQ